MSSAHPQDRLYLNPFAYWSTIAWKTRDRATYKNARLSICHYAQYKNTRTNAETNAGTNAGTNAETNAETKDKNIRREESKEGKEEIGANAQTKRATRFLPPIVEEVQAYIREKGYAFDLVTRSHSSGAMPALLLPRVSKLVQKYMPPT